MSASRINKLFLDVLKFELDKMNITDITSVQAVILYNIGRSKLSVGDIISKGYYIGSNVSYNIKKMIDAQYILQEISEYDKRINQIQLTEKGMDLYEKIHEKIIKYGLGKEGIKVQSNDIESTFKKMYVIESALNSIAKR
ncbi:winged helix DNA-binding protein [Candidatus Gromoviella agglomerans]|uniref:winged helix DNA-binding protein n=1 Tax=Candidatus Gromoviella agglomerans TaxID=2806609 RepID=UPI001E63B809|nr:winged helix DNA-binding protein [Candidatus Gromoviella agglomerans]